MNGRTRFVVTAMAILYVISWAFSLAPLFGVHFWNRKAHHFDENEVDGIVAGKSTAMVQVGSSYYQLRRYLYFLPHVLGVILWWNLYFLQLIPSVRHAYNKQFHRWLGRVLMVTALLQTASGIGLASTSHSNVIQLVSYVLAIAVFFCIAQAWKYARHGDIPKHKHWAMRLVGYMHTITLQRFWFVGIIIVHGIFGKDDPDNTSTEQANIKLYGMFDDSFILAILTAILVTEWYLDAEQGMLEAPVRRATTTPQQQPAADLPNPEKRPLL